MKKSLSNCIILVLLFSLTLSQTALAFQDNSLYPEGSVIAFSSFARGITSTWAIWTIDPNDPGNISLVVDTGYDDTYPVWSPDGSRLVFTRRDGMGYFSLWLVNADGSGLRQLNYSWSPGIDGGMYPLAWHPNSEKVYFTKSPAYGPTCALYWIDPDLDVSQPENLLTGVEEKCTLDVSFYGSKVVTTSYGLSNGYQIGDLSGDGTEVTNLLPPIFNTYKELWEPMWSPDGSRIAFGLDDGTSRTYIRTSYPDGTDVDEVSWFDEAVPSRPTWSPDGRWISFAADGEIYTNSSIGALFPDNLTNDTVPDMHPIWAHQQAGAIPLPDFIIHNFSTLPLEPIFMESTTIIVHVKNIGAAYHSSGEKADLWIMPKVTTDGDEWIWIAQFEMSDLLDPSQTLYLDPDHFRFTDKDVDELEICIFPEIHETSSLNNCLSNSIFVHPPSSEWDSCKGTVTGTLDAVLELYPLEDALRLLKLMYSFLSAQQDLLESCGTPSSPSHGDQCLKEVYSLTYNAIIDLTKEVPGLLSGRLVAILKAIGVAVTDAPECGSYLSDILYAAVLEAQHKRQDINIILIESPIFAVIEDSAGRQAGFLADGTPVNDIPDSDVYEKDGKKIIIYPSSASTLLELWGSDSGVFDLSISITKGDSEVHNIIYDDISVYPNTVGQINLTDSSYSLLMDDDGNGSTDRSVAPTSINITDLTWLYLPLISR